GEGVGMGVGRRVGHPGVAVAEQDDLVVADDSGAPVEAGAADRGDVGADLGAVHGGVEDVAGLTAGAGHEHGAHALGVVAGDRARALRRLVVGVGVDGQQAERVVGHRRPRYRPGAAVRTGPPLGSHRDTIFNTRTTRRVPRRPGQGGQGPSTRVIVLPLDPSPRRQSRRLWRVRSRHRRLRTHSLHEPSRQGAFLMTWLILLAIVAVVALLYVYIHTCVKVIRPYQKGLLE